MDTRAVVVLVCAFAAILLLAGAIIAFMACNRPHHMYYHRPLSDEEMQQRVSNYEKQSLTF